MKPLIFVSAYRQLTDYEREFVDGFMRSLDNEASKRHERLTLTLARISNTLDVSRLDDRSRDLFAKPLVIAAIRERTEEIAAERDLTPEWIVKQYHNIASASLENYFTVGEDGFPQIDLSRLTSDQWAALQEVDAIEEFGKGKTVRRVKVKLQPKMEALGKLMAHTGLDKADNPVYGAYKQTAIADASKTPSSASVADLAEAYARLIE